MSRRLFAIISFLGLFFNAEIFTHAAPIPATSSSEFSQTLKNMILAEREGFRLGTQKTDFWEIINKNIATNNSAPTSWLFQGIGTKQTARFSIRTDKLTQPIELPTYVKKWIKEYPYLGFEILATNTMQVAGKPTFVVDLINKGKNKQLRQFVVHNKDRNIAVIMTCTDSIDKFNSTLDQCHDLLHNFQWTAQITQSLKK